MVNDGIFRCLEVEKLSGQAKENAKKNIDAYFTFLSKEKKEAAKAREAEMSKPLEGEAFDSAVAGLKDKFSGKLF